jgi:2-dehydro-3-deoxyphosphogluconate aldolase/(4S)-4-hydroxy-2-oxoglutarate aldolase
MKFDIPVVGILRGVAPAFFQDLMSASFTSGLEAIEVTINSPDAEKIVSHAAANIPQGKWLGMGTIRNLDEAKRAVDSGAMFLVSPNCDSKVIDFAVARNIPMLAGALTPTEVHRAYANGATLIKVFPCDAMGGPVYIKSLLAPLESVPLIAVGGVTLENADAYFKAGACAVGTSTALFGKDALEERNCEKIAQNVKQFMLVCHQARIKKMQNFS